MSSEALEFLSALARRLPEETRLITCGFVGDPNIVGTDAWRPRPWAPGRDLIMAPAANAYVTVAAFNRAPDRSFRRRKETFAAGLALMVDDVGTKVSPATVSVAQASAIVETSPSNFQHWFFLEEPERDPARFDGVIRAFISDKLLGADPGMSGVTRVGRIPGFVNGKPQHAGWRCALRELNAQRYSVEELLERFALKINGRRGFTRDVLVAEEALERNAMFAVAYKFLDRRGMLKRAEPDPSGWTEMRCPWVDEHTGRADTGAAVREPAPENEYYGAFRCHHGHCVDRGWADLNEWIAEVAESELAANAEEAA